MEDPTLAVSRRQIEITWGLAELGLKGLTDDEALWCPAPESWTVRPGDDGRWHADWVEPEPWPAPPTSIAWIQWHVIWWWSTVLNRSFGDGELRREHVTWPGTGDSMVAIEGLQERWLGHLAHLNESDFSSGDLTAWPYTDGRPFRLVVAWVNIELMKNVAEMCLLRRASPLFAADGRKEIGGGPM